jgi:hypothetical protein
MPLAYHALSWPRKTPTACVSGSNSLPTWLDSRTLDHAQSNAPHGQILSLVTFTVRSVLQILSSHFEAKFGDHRLASNTTADEFVEFASPHFVILNAPASADSMNSYAHGAARHLFSRPNTPSATAPEPPTQYADQTPCRAPPFTASSSGANLVNRRNTRRRVPTLRCHTPVHRAALRSVDLARTKRLRTQAVDHGVAEPRFAQRSVASLID